MAMFDDSGPDRLYAYAYARLVPQLIHGLLHVCGWRVSISLTLVDMALSTVCVGDIEGVVTCGTGRHVSHVIVRRTSTEYDYANHVSWNINRYRSTRVRYRNHLLSYICIE